MAILLVNLGTSDISIKIGDYYIPMGFDRSEKNITLPEKQSERKAWDNRDELIRQFLDDIKLKYSLNEKNGQIIGINFIFRDLTSKVLELYNDNPDKWFDRIRSCRIQEIIEKSFIRYELSKIIFFATNQNIVDPNGHKDDTFYLSQLITNLIQKKYPDRNIEIQVIDINFSAVDMDQLFNFYFNHLKKINSDEIILISLKGGTPQMQTALRIQASAASIKRQIFLEPKLHISSLLKGEPSECKRVSYWRYMRSQKYQTVTELLNRWDFSGAEIILQSWSSTLQSLIDSKVEDDDNYLVNSKVTIDIISIYLSIANLLFCLDIDTAIQKIEEVKRKSRRFNKLIIDEIEKININYNFLNELIAQFKIFCELQMTSDALIRCSMFYEAAQEELLHHLIGDHNIYDHDGFNLNLFIEQYPDNWNTLSERAKSDLFRKYNESLNNNRRKMYIYRDHKKKIILCLNNNRNLIKYFMKLDFWYELRNNLIHQSKGFSSERIEIEYRSRDQRRHRNTVGFNDVSNLLTTINSSINPHRDDKDIFSVIRSHVISELNADLTFG